MELLNTISSYDLNEKSIDITAVCFIPSAKIICIGTDFGIVYYYDCTSNDFIKTNQINSQGYIMSINYFKNTKKELIFVTSLEGIITTWDLEKLDSKLKTIHSRKKHNQNEDKLTVLSKTQLNNMNSKELCSLFNLYLNEEMNNQKGGNKVTNQAYAYTPSLKYMLNTNSIIKEAGILDKKYEILCTQYSNYSDLVYTGGHKGYLFSWNYQISSYKASFSGHETDITCMTIDRHLLISGDRSGKICIISLDLGSVLYSLVNRDLPNSRIVDLLMLPAYGFLISINSYSQIEFWIYETNKLIFKIPVKKELTCLQFVDNYGKLLCGTSE